MSRRTNPNNEFVTVSTNEETICKAHGVKPNSRVGARYVALVKEFGGKMTTKAAILAFIKWFIMNDPQYNLRSKKYNGDHNDPSNAKQEAGCSYNVLKKEGFIIQLN